MKITKIRTKGGEFRSPVSTELDAVIERMRSDETKAAADLIAKGCLYSRLAMKQGMPRYYLIDVDRLPFLLFGATFGKAGLDHPKTFTGLVMLNIPCPEGLRQVQEMDWAATSNGTPLRLAGRLAKSREPIFTLADETPPGARLPLGMPPGEAVDCVLFSPFDAAAMDA